METAIRTTRSTTEADEWALVLSAAGIPHRLERAEAGWTLLVPDPDVSRVHEVLNAYDEERREEPAAILAESASARHAWATGLAVGALLLAFFALTGPPAARSRWFERGAAASDLMMSSEPWRAVTALTLHADTVHVVGNAVAIALLLPPIVRRLGPGGGVWLVLVAGTGANLLAAAAHGARHVSIGASTATFGALGILAALRLRPGSRATRARGRWWTVPVAAVLLLAMLGTAQGADVLGHALGLVSGGALGFVVARWGRPLAAPIQWALVGAAALTVVSSWYVALSGPTH